MIWFQKQRVGFIMKALATTGRLNRADVVKRFEVSTQSASADFARIAEIYPDAWRYDGSAKAYFPGAKFEDYRAEAEAFVVSGDEVPANA